METKNYVLNAGPNLNYNITLSDTELFIEVGLLRKKIQVPIGQVTKLHLTSQLGKVKFTVHYREGEKDKKWPFTVEAYDSDAADFIKSVKSLATSAQWHNEFEVPANEVGVKRTYPIATRLFGKYMQRWGILLMWGLLSLMILPLPIFLYILFAGGYTATTNDAGITAKKFVPKNIAWADMKSLNFSLLDITFKSYGASVGRDRWCRFQAESHSGTKMDFYVPGIKGAQLLKELVARGKLDAGYLKEVVI